MWRSITNRGPHIDQLPKTSASKWCPRSHWPWITPRNGFHQQSWPSEDTRLKKKQPIRCIYWKKMYLFPNLAQLLCVLIYHIFYHILYIRLLWSIWPWSWWRWSLLHYITTRFWYSTLEKPSWKNFARPWAVTVLFNNDLLRMCRSASGWLSAPPPPNWQSPQRSHEITIKLNYY